MTEQYSIGYSEGYQDGWNRSIEEAESKKQWVGLTPTEIELIACFPWGETSNWVKAIESALKTKNEL